MFIISIRMRSPAQRAIPTVRLSAIAPSPEGGPPSPFGYRQ
ncbi:hypothetical protein [Nostoc favosum]|nr:hypothetical protein [Nostoc favosum]